MELDSQRVWDYASDVYVHRIIQDKTNGKFLDMTTATTDTSTTTLNDHEHNNNSNNNHDPNNEPHTVDNDDREDEEDDYVPRSKLTNIGLEYTTLLTSQLDSQRRYFEASLERAADKASTASTLADRATAALSTRTADLSALETAHATLLTDTIPALDRDRARAVRRADRFETTARTLEREWRDEKALNAGLMDRVKRLEDGVEQGNGKLASVTAEVEDLRDLNRDLTAFIEAGEQVGRLVGEAGAGEGGVVDEEDVRGGTVGVVVPPATGGGGGGGGDGKSGKSGGRKGKGKK